jgi:cytochrome b6-f complex iron-sulfur subunit
MTRRSVLNVFLGGSLAATAAAFLYPVLRYLWPQGQQEAVQTKVVAAKTGELAPNSFKIFRFGDSPGILIDSPEGTLLAFTAVCTHLSCTVRYDSDSGTIYCPCHNGRFDLSGRVISGPPPAPLEEYVVESVGGDIVVSKKG